MNTREIQLALQAKGFDPGPIDGVRGRMTIARGQGVSGGQRLVVDGIVGPTDECGAVRPAAADQVDDAGTDHAAWYAEAWRLIGIDEDVGAGSNRMILKWAEDLDIPYRGRRDCLVRALRRPLHRLATHGRGAAGRAAGCAELGALWRPCVARSRAPSWCSGGVRPELQGPCCLLCRRGRDALPCPRRQPVQHGLGDADHQAAVHRFALAEDRRCRRPAGGISWRRTERRFRTRNSSLGAFAGALARLDSGGQIPP